MRLRLEAFLILTCAISLMHVGCSPGGSRSGKNVSEAGLRTSVKQEGKPASVGTALGILAPDFQLTRMDGSLISLAGLRGKPAVLVFWTAWCPFCKDEAPHINDLNEQYAPRGVNVLGINVQESRARTEEGIEEFGIRYPVARDSDGSVSLCYKVVATPTIIFLDKDGAVRYFGNRLPEDYHALLETLVNQ
jgi:peroxiredoxin